MRSITIEQYDNITIEQKNGTKNNPRVHTAASYFLQ